MNDLADAILARADAHDAERERREASGSPDPHHGLVEALRAWAHARVEGDIDLPLIADAMIYSAVAICADDAASGFED